MISIVSERRGGASNYLTPFPLMACVYIYYSLSEVRLSLLCYEMGEGVRGAMWSQTQAPPLLNGKSRYSDNPGLYCYQ